jgi:hypothetical protein
MVPLVAASRINLERSIQRTRNCKVKQSEETISVARRDKELDAKGFEYSRE